MQHIPETMMVTTSLKQILLQMNPHMAQTALLQIVDTIAAEQNVVNDMQNEHPYKIGLHYIKEFDLIIKQIPVVDQVMFSCKKGCSHCCNMNVDMNEYEAAAIVDYCVRNSISIDEETLELQEHLSEVQRFKSKFRKCVFLVNNECSIYPVRPIACRKYFVTSAPADCNKFGAKVEVGAYFSIEKLLTALNHVGADYGNMATMIFKALDRNEQDTNN